MIRLSNWRPHRLLVVGKSDRRPRSAISAHCDRRGGLHQGRRQPLGRFDDGDLGEGDQADPLRLWRRGAGLLELRRQETRTTSFTISARTLNTAFIEFHATTMDNPLLPKRAGNESVEEWLERRARFLEDLKQGQRSAGLCPGISGRVRRLVGRRLLQPRKAARRRSAASPPGQLRRCLRGHRHRVQDRHRQRRDGGDILRPRHSSARPAVDPRLGYHADRRRDPGDLVA